MIEGKIFFGEEGYRLTGLLRYKVFCEELNLQPEKEHDFIDFFAYHLSIYEGDEVVGAGRLSLQNDKFIVDRICVKKEKRNDGIGDMIVRMLSFKALELGTDKIYTYSEEKYLDFYKKIGFDLLEQNVIHIDINMNLLCLNNGLRKGCCNDCNSDNINK